MSEKPTEQPQEQPKPDKPPVPEVEIDPLLGDYIQKDLKPGKEGETRQE